jgi:hypothetical protein
MNLLHHDNKRLACLLKVSADKCQAYYTDLVVAELVKREQRV